MDSELHSATPLFTKLLRKKALSSVLISTGLLDRQEALYSCLVQLGYVNFLRDASNFSGTRALVYMTSIPESDESEWNFSFASIASWRVIK